LSNVETGYMDLQVTDGTGGAQKSIIRLGTISTGTLGERLRIDDAGRLINGGVAAQIANPAGNLLPGFQLHGTTNDFVQFAQYRWTADASQPVFRLIKSRGASIGTWTLVQNGDNLGSIFFNGADGSVPQTAAAINASVDGTASTAVMPGKLTFQTAQAGGVTLATALTLDAAQNAFFGKNLTATTGTFSASSGSFSGNITAVAGSFTGNVSTSANVIASSGSFSGTLTVSGSGNHQFDGALQAELGTSGSYASTINNADVDTTAVGNSGTGEDDLITYVLPANSFSANAKGVRITAWGRLAATAGGPTRSVRVYFGTQTVATYTTVADTALVWEAKAMVFKTGSSTQDYYSNMAVSAAAATISTGTATQTDTNTITIKCTGQTTAAINDQVVQDGMFVEFIN
jgi:hypothetical protein